MPDSSTTSPSIPADFVELKDKFRTSNAKIQLQLLPQILAAGASGVEFEIEWLQEQRQAKPTVIAGAVYQSLYQSEFPSAREYLDKELPKGIVPLRSSMGVDYTLLQQLLAQQDFQAADKLNNQKLCELAGADAVGRKWIYFTEVEQLPSIDLQTIDTLWQIHSEGKFGFSIQREIWLGSSKDWSKLWAKIAWKSGNNWTRYPGAFTWDLTAPRGHLPLSNQLRGVRAISSLLSHPAWEQTDIL
jgi:GUN4-like/ARM-like repeat domain, GUN4-N terminal